VIDFLLADGPFIHPTLRVKIVPTSAAHSPLLSVLKWNSEGLVPAIVQDAESSEVLMMAWMNSQALATTLETGQTHFYSRSRRSLWHKGGTSGHVQLVESIRVDCDADVLLIKVRQKGGACHEGYRSCFFRRVDEAHGLEIVDRPIFDAERVYASGRDVSNS
jgi:phosphoribosyl-AMP cyclohydrolase